MRQDVEEAFQLINRTDSKLAIAARRELKDFIAIRKQHD
jgi:hypothetical protein